MHFLHQQSSDTDLATIMKTVVGHSSYPKKLTVKVLCSDPATTYIYDKKEKREMMNTVVADSSKVVKCVVNDAKKFHRFKAGTTIILRNIIRKKLSQVRQWYFLHHKPSTSHHIWRRKGWPFCIPPPPVDVKSVEEALACPTKTKVFFSLLNLLVLFPSNGSEFYAWVFNVASIS